MTARISYNGKTIDITQIPYRLKPDYPGAALVNRSASRLVETLNVASDVLIAIAWRNFRNSNAADATLKRQLQQWFEWARCGNAWSLARDAAETVNTIITTATAGSATVDMMSTAGVDAGALYVLRSLTHVELVKILSVDSSTRVTLVETLNFDFATGDRFRSEQFWPARLVSNQNPIVEHPPAWYDLELTFAEDVNSL